MPYSFTGCCTVLNGSFISGWIFKLSDSVSYSTFITHLKYSSTWCIEVELRLLLNVLYYKLNNSLETLVRISLKSVHSLLLFSPVFHKHGCQIRLQYSRVCHISIGRLSHSRLWFSADRGLCLHNLLPPLIFTREKLRRGVSWAPQM